MKFIKLSIFALTMGLFIASCGNGDTAAEGTTDTTVVVEPVAETPAPVADTMTAPVADTAAAPAH
jgi:ABC-type glycerol-3-phosphate transport system substrate-binding protein